MFRLQKNRPPKSSENQKIDFKFSHFKALQVPKGLDKLFVSVISKENGRTIAKSSKASVRNGSCQWPDTFQESIWISRDNSSKETENCLLRLIVATGSSKSGTLGEATINLISYMSSSDANILSIPLNKCNHGTVLHVKVQCLTPSTKFRDEESKLTNSQNKGLRANNYDVAVKSNGSNSSYVQSVESSSTSSPREVDSRGASFSASDSNCSYNSADGSVGMGSFFPSINLEGDGQSPTGRQVSTSSQNCDSPANNPSNSNGSSSFRKTNSSKSRLDAAEETVEELRAEAKMWEMNARRLMVDLDKLRADFLDRSKLVENLGVELSSAHAERDSLKNEVEELKLLLEDPMVKQKDSEDSTLQGECVPEIEQAVKDELKFQKESNANLSLQLRRSQESNIELVSVLQELEETTVQQKMEISNLSALSSKFNDLENSFQVSIEENRNLMVQLQQLEESKKILLVKVQQLEEALAVKKHDTESAKSQNDKALLDIETEYRSKLSAKEEEILSLKAKVSESFQEMGNAEIMSRNGNEADLIREIESLKEKVQELETDCNELTDENLGLLFKLKEATKNSRKEDASDDYSPGKLGDQCFPSFESKISNDASKILQFDDILQEKDPSEIKNSDCLSIQELESIKTALEVRITELGKEAADKTSKVANLEENLLSKENDIVVLQKCQSELEAKVHLLQKENFQLEEHMEVMLKERDVNSKCLSDLRNDLVTLSRSMDSHISANKILERKSLDLENEKHELELCISEIEQEKEKLSMHVSVLEARLRELTNGRKSSLSELEDSKSQVTRLQEEIAKIKSEMNSSKEDMKQKLKVTQLQWSEAQEECEYLRRANQKLQIVIENLTEECSSLQKLNGDLRKQKMELQEYCSLMGSRLRESDQKFADFIERIELLEKNCSMMHDDNAAKEKSLTSELDMLLDENRRHMEQVQSLLSQLHMEKKVEIQNLHQEIEHLSMKLSATCDDKEGIASNAALEVSALRSDKAKLESAFQEVQSKIISSKNEANIVRAEYEQKLQDLTTELAAFKVNKEMLMADREKMLKLAEDYKSREEKLQSTVNALELKLTVVEYERQQLMEEFGTLKIQLQQIHQFEDQIMSLKNELSLTNSEKGRLEASLQVTSELCEDLKAAKNSFEVKISTLENAVIELEECKRSRASLEERLLQMESDFKAREASFAQDSEQKNQLSHSKRINRQYEETIQLLEQEKDEFLTIVHTLEEELKLTKEKKQNQMSKINRIASPVNEDPKVSKNTSQHRNTRKMSSLKNGRENVKDQQDLISNKHHNEVETEYGSLGESTKGVGVDPLPKTQLLEIELAEAKRLVSEGQNNQVNGPLKSTAEGELVTKENFERTKSALEAELRDIQERYLHMSLKYAEVEAQREELVMKLKATKNRKGWFF